MHDMHFNPTDAWYLQLSQKFTNMYKNSGGSESQEGILQFVRAL